VSQHDRQLEYAEDHPWQPDARDDDDPGRIEFDDVVYLVEQRDYFGAIWRQHAVDHPASKLAPKEIAAWEKIRAGAMERKVKR
jgi:hypothetical protein